MARGKPFEKGNKLGKKKGKHKKTIAWEMLGDFLTESGAERAKKVIMKSEDKEFMSYYLMLLEYFKPKQSRAEIKNDDTTKIADSLSTLIENLDNEKK